MSAVGPQFAQWLTMQGRTDFLLKPELQASGLLMDSIVEARLSRVHR